MSRFLRVVLGLILLVTGGCDLVDPTRSASHPDTEVFGNLLQVSQGELDSVSWDRISEFEATASSPLSLRFPRFLPARRRLSCQTRNLRLIRASHPSGRFE